MLRPYPGSKQEVRQISLPKLKTTARITPARYSFLKYRPIYPAVTGDENIFTIHNKKKKPKNFYFCKA